jgi:hypothetical protein
MTTNEVLKQRVDTLDKKVDGVCSDIKTIKENHMAHMETDIRELKTDMKWVKKIQWYAITTALSNLVGIVLILLFK